MPNVLSSAVFFAFWTVFVAEAAFFGGTAKLRI
jgi:hypothetical protein